ncbi:transmembrane protein 47-like isoform X1 [Ornithodoros turicata]|uniref:transmembrane protein 47-like isoform X1 n=1 Tax=Ornithodoros turicata TaxID=34597 RepID=UPI003139063D
MAGALGPGRPPPPQSHANHVTSRYRHPPPSDSSDEDYEDCCCLTNFIRTCNVKQVFAFICGLIVILLMILCLASSNWLIAHKFRQGLWEQCVDEDAPLPLPFGLNAKPGCYVARTVAYIQAAAALCVITLLCDIAATVMTGCGLCSKNPVRKYLMYRLAFYVMVCALLCILVALVIYPACFAAEIEESNRQVWEFGWAYGVGWGAAIFLFGAILLLLCDKETEEIYYRERTVANDAGGGGDSKA